MPAIEAEKYAMLNFEIEKAEGSDFELIHNVKISAKWDTGTENLSQRNLTK